MSKPQPSQTTLRVRRFIAEAAISKSESMPLADRSLLYNEISHLLEGPERDAAQLISFGLKETEKHQLKLTQLLKEAKQ